jgi:hypothetical protein
LLPVGRDPGGVEAGLPLQRGVHPGRVGKNPVFFCLTSPVGFFGFFDFLGFFDIFAQKREFLVFFQFQESRF